MTPAQFQRVNRLRASTYFGRQVFDEEAIQDAIQIGISQSRSLPSKYPIGEPASFILENEQGLPTASINGILVAITFYVDKIYYVVAVPIAGINGYYTVVSMPSEAMCSTEELK